MPSKWSFQSRLISFKYAFNGFKLMFIGNPNLIIQSVVAFLVLIFAIIFNFSTLEWAIILICIAMVLAAEIFNTAIEILSDFVCQENNDKIAKLKDISAAAVLLLSIFSAIIGLIIFIPKIF